MTRRKRSDRPPTARQTECFVAYARLGDGVTAARLMGLSIQSLKRNVGEHNRRIGANSSIQAAYMLWGPKPGDRTQSG